MSLAAIAFAIERSTKHGSFEDVIWRQVAFLGRYAHQQAPNVLNMPSPRVAKLVRAVGQLLDEEHKAMKGRR